MTTFVLIHGAWHGGWCWDHVIRELKSRGHRVIAPDLPGLGTDTTPLQGLTLAGWADHIANIIRNCDEPVVLVGHSRGGVVISEVAERVPDRIQRLVYLAAFLVPGGKTLTDMLFLDAARDVARDAMVMQPDGISSVIPTERVAELFYNTTPPELQVSAAEKLRPEPMMSFMTPLSLSEGAYGRVERTYVECLQDRAIPIELQRAMQSALPCSTVLTLDSDHSPFLSQPAQLAAALLGTCQAVKAA
jgi:pimeloyl-ACP methyl ester carboxylesterase